MSYRRCIRLFWVTAAFIVLFVLNAQATVAQPPHPTPTTVNDTSLHVEDIEPVDIELSTGQTIAAFPENRLSLESLLTDLDLTVRLSELHKSDDETRAMLRFSLEPKAITDKVTTMAVRVNGQCI